MSCTAALGNVLGVKAQIRQAMWLYTSAGVENGVRVAFGKMGGSGSSILGVT